MIPLCLRVRNFMSYGDKGAHLDFDAFHIACLCGENGHGKSALLDAITWALWGRARGKSEDDLVQIGKQDMEVQLDFALGADRYRVLRKRTLRGARRPSVATVELQLYDGDRGYLPLTEDSVTATQRKLRDILRIDYETFINSAYIIQGRADEFTVKKPVERKQILADLLGLEQYERLEERARDESRGRQNERALIESAIAVIDGDLSQRPRHEADLAAAQAQIASAEERRKLADAELQRWRAEQRGAEERAIQVAQLRERRTQDARECETLRARLHKECSELAAAEALVARGPEARAQAHRLDVLRAREEALGRAAGELVELSDRAAALERDIARELALLSGKLQVGRAEEARLRALSSRTDELTSAHKKAEDELAGLRALEEKRETLRATTQRCESDARALNESNGRLRAEMVELREKMNLLNHAGATCPICLGELTPAGRATAQAELEKQGKAKAATYRQQEARAKELSLERAGAERAANDLEQLLAGRAALEGRIATLATQRDEADTAATTVADLSVLITQLDGQIQRQEFLPTEHAELHALRARIASSGYDRAAHDAVRAEIATLRLVESLVAEIEIAEGQIEPARQRAAETADLLAGREAALAATAATLAELQAAAADRAELERRLTAASLELDEAIKASQAASTAVGIAQQRLEHCRVLAEQRVEKVAQLGRANDERAIYDELTLAFGKKGIQAMIIESAIPEIEAEANELLNRLTDGGLSLAFETQRDARSREGVIETLDIRISDEYGTRDYEMYSGGEAFRVNFAIRVALSKLLARRAGAQLQLLVVDEGFGTQDATGRERLVEAINTVSADFEKILVVTHIQELKDAFPVRIDVQKGPEGSQVVATTVLDG